MAWREWKITLRLVSRAYALGIISGSAQQGTGTGWRLTYVRLRGQRPYILGIERERWGHPWHRLRYGHWPENVGFGACGTCFPWPCCGATGLDHADDCEEA